MVATRRFFLKLVGLIGACYYLVCLVGFKFLGQPKKKKAPLYGDAAFEKMGKSLELALGAKRMTGKIY